jgi:hypothetical protein
MGVYIGSRFYIAVSHPNLYLLQARPVLHHEARHAVTQIMKAYYSQTRLNQKPSEIVVDRICSNRRAVAMHYHIVVHVVPLAKFLALLFLPRFDLQKVLFHSINQR